MPVGKRQRTERREVRKRQPKRRLGIRLSTRALTWLAGAALILVISLLVSLDPASPATLSRPEPAPTPGPSRAALIDQLALTDPDPQFTQEAVSYLQLAGFQVDAYQGEEVTVDFYRTLPARDYRLILIRTHSTNVLNVDGRQRPGPVFLFTSDLYSRSKWLREQVMKQVGAVRVVYDDSNTRYFGIVAGFVRERMVGQFEDTLVILGGCQSLATLDLAQALVERGASAIIGWDEWVDLPHNDQALLKLLKSLTVESMSVEQAVEATMQAVGPDPTFHSRLTYFSPAHRDYTVQDLLRGTDTGSPRD